MKPLGLLLAPAALWLANSPSGEDAGKKEMQKLQGTWILAALKAEGVSEDLEESDLAIVTLIIRQDTFTLKLAGMEVARGILRLDPTATPKRLDAQGKIRWKGMPEGAPGKLLGIYKLEGDTLWICGRLFEEPPDGRQSRPTDFKVERGDTTQAPAKFRRDRP